MNFKEWLKFDEVGTSTSCVASFSRMTIPMFKRVWAIQSKKQKPYEQPQVQENVLVRAQSLAHKASSMPPQMLKQELAQIIQVLGQEGNESDPHYIELASVVRDNILPIIKGNMMFRNDYDMLDALSSSYL